VDDGGEPTTTGPSNACLNWQHDKAHDGVWPQPATVAEIQIFYEVQAKKAAVTP
jgi:hypothetical protein